MKSYNPNTLKKSALIFVISMLAAVVLITGCNNTDQKVEEAQSTVVEANRELQEANREYQAAIDLYRKETSERIAANDSTITAFKARMANETVDAKADYEKQLVTLEQKNSDMKKKLAAYKAEGKEQWETFKTDFNREMNILVEALDKLKDKIS